MRIPTKIQIGPRHPTRREVLGGLLFLKCAICGQKHTTIQDRMDCEAADRSSMGDKTLIDR